MIETPEPNELKGVRVKSIKILLLVQKSSYKHSLFIPVYKLRE